MDKPAVPVPKLHYFENELAGTKFTVNCTRKAWTEAVAPGMVSSYHGGVSIKAMNSCVQATVPLHFLAVLMCMSIALAANLQLFVQDMSIVFEILSRWIFFCTDSFCYCLSTVLCFCPTVPSQSFLADFCTVRQSLSLFWFDSWSFWIFWALLAWCLARLIFDWLFVPFSFASAKPRRVFAARFIGGRRYRQARKPCARFRKHQSSHFYLRIVRLGLQFLSGPISGFLLS